MKVALPLLLALLLLACTQDNLQQISEDELFRRIVEQEMPDPSDVQIFDVEGKEMSVDDLQTMESSGKYFEDFYVNKQDEIVKIIVREKTTKDDEFIAKINLKLNESPPLKSVEIDCDDKVNLLQNIFDRDQEIRRGDNQLDSKIDHENLEVIVSFLEKCGMPTLQEVNDVQMAGIWAVLQHAPTEYQSKYISLLEKSAENGDIKWSVIALMKDRALMNERKPQIYGSQVRNGELYELFEPEFVNQRRAAIGMDPIEVYLKRFDIEFNIEQKEK